MFNLAMDLEGKKHKSYRKSHRKNELFQMLRNKEYSDKCVVWQTREHKRYVYYSESLNINTKFKTCMVTLKEIPALDLSQPVYIRFEDGIMFKTNAINCIQECLSFYLPEEFMAYENRENSRLKFKTSDAHYAVLSLIADITKKSTQEMSFQIIDISTHGMSLNLTETYLERLMQSKEIYLNKLFMVNLAQSIKCEFIYTKKIKYKFNGDIYTGNRVGLSFERPIEDYLLTLTQ
jgi:hypothetical protein